MLRRGMPWFFLIKHEGVKGFKNFVVQGLGCFLSDLNEGDDAFDDHPDLE